MEPRRYETQHVPNRVPFSDMNLRAILLSTLFGLSAISAAADKDIEALLAKMRTAYSSAKTARLKVACRITQNNQKMSVGVALQYSSGNKVKATVTGLPQVPQYDAVTDGKQIELKAGTNKRVQTYGLDPLNGFVVANLETLCFWDWKRQLSTGVGGNMRESKLKLASMSWNGKNWTILEETASKQQLFVKYFIDPKTNLIHRTIVLSLATQKELGDYQVQKLEVNVAVEPGQFKIGGSAVRV